MPMYITLLPTAYLLHAELNDFAVTARTSWFAVVDAKQHKTVLGITTKKRLGTRKESVALTQECTRNELVSELEVQKERRTDKELRNKSRPDAVGVDKRRRFCIVSRPASPMLAILLPQGSYTAGG